MFECGGCIERHRPLLAITKPLSLFTKLASKGKRSALVMSLHGLPTGLYKYYNNQTQRRICQAMIHSRITTRNNRWGKISNTWQYSCKFEAKNLQQRWQKSKKILSRWLETCIVKWFISIACHTENIYVTLFIERIIYVVI